MRIPQIPNCGPKITPENFHWNYWPQFGIFFHYGIYLWIGFLRDIIHMQRIPKLITNDDISLCLFCCFFFFFFLKEKNCPRNCLLALLVFCIVNLLGAIPIERKIFDC
uniref:Uncharacterized protein n=1 Tax=Cacopsylla melanoneura TaxID=428564 RepID=A0A8D9EYH4_9HEMI